MRSVKDIIIGFLLILIGFALSAYSLPVSIAVAECTQKGEFL